MVHLLLHLVHLCISNGSSFIIDRMSAEIDPVTEQSLISDWFSTYVRIDSTINLSKLCHSGTASSNLRCGYFEVCPFLRSSTSPQWSALIHLIASKVTNLFSGLTHTVFTPLGLLQDASADKPYLFEGVVIEQSLENFHVKKCTKDSTYSP